MAPKSAQSLINVRSGGMPAEAAAETPLFESLPVASFSCDGAGRVVRMNSAAIELFWRSAEGHPALEELIRSSVLPHMWDGLRAQGRWTGAVDGLRPDGSWVATDWTVSARTDADGALSGAVIVAVDATQRRQAEAALRDSCVRWQALVESAPDFILQVDREGVVRFVNKARGPLRPEEAVGRPWRNVLPADHWQQLGDAIESVVKTGEPLSFESLAGGPDGQRRWYGTHVGPLRQGADLAGVVVMARDITDRKLYEAQLLVSDRMASVGTLAAGVAHEINNPLGSLIANLDLALRDLGDLRAGRYDGGELEEELREAREAADRIRQIVRGLKVFSRGEADTRGPVDVHKVLDSTLRLAWNEVRHRAHLVKSFDRATPPVEANESRLGQVFLSLVVNAAQAIAEGQAETNEIRVETRMDAGGMVVVEVSDTGPGMTPAVMERLFTPFFTTKPVGMGTGLGLSICQRIVDGLGGEIRVSSAIGKGTTFSVYLPVARTKTEPSRAPLGPIATVAASDPPEVGLGALAPARVLVVDDDVAMGVVVRRLLGGDHDIIVASEAEVALARIISGERFDIVLCDLMMPRMTGMDLHAELVRRAPSYAERMVFMTGGTFTARSRNFLASVTNPSIEKPFDGAQLRELIGDRLRAIHAAA